MPFCFHKCHYCDFYSIVESQGREQKFVARLILEIQAAERWLAPPLQSIFIGGGTPTLLPVPLWERLLAAMHDSMPLSGDGEWTVEANPETVTPELAAVLAQGGVNRISIGAQSFDARHLKMLERWHDPHNVARSVGIFHAHGIGNINLDLIFGIPGQTLADWRCDLQRAIDLEPSHLSCYGLMYEHNTPMTHRMEMGLIERIDPDVEASMYELALDMLDEAGFEQYEISNWARRDAQPLCTRTARPSPSSDGNNTKSEPAGARCRHNLAYWRNENWWAFGPSASGHLSGLRWKNLPHLGEYLQMPDESDAMPPVTDVECVDGATRAGEQFMLGLRLIDGLALGEVERLFHESGARADGRRQAIERHCAVGLLEVGEEHLRLTRRGLMLANDVLVDLV